jgi:hypothetical protein
MMAWRVGSKTKVTLFKGDEIWGVLQSEEKAAVVVRWLNWAEMADGGTSWLSQLSNAQLRVIRNAVVNEELRRGVEAGGRQAEGGAEGDPVAPCEHFVWLPASRTWGGGGCPPFCGDSAGE